MIFILYLCYSTNINYIFHISSPAFTFTTITIFIKLMYAFFFFKDELSRCNETIRKLGEVFNHNKK